MLTRSWLSEQPRLYLPLARRRYPGPSPEVVGADTRLVIDGYTRAASTHVVYAFQLSQPAPVRLAHHVHAPAQLIESVRRGLPTLVLVREPEGTVLSQVLREPHVVLPDALWAYARFHERLLPYRQSFVVADFTEVTQDVAPAVRRLNAAFGTSFVEPDIRSLAADLDELIALRATLWPTLLAFESGTVSREQLRDALRDPVRRPGAATSADDWLPSAQRTAAKDALRGAWEQPALDAAKRRARQAYEALSDGS